MTVELPQYFVNLRTASSSRPGSDVSIIGVISDFLPARKSSGTDWTCTFSVADQTLGFVGEVGQEGLKVRFFKKLQTELPQIWGTGDVIILRNMKIKEFNGMTVAISSYGSTWAVIHASSIPNVIPVKPTQLPHEKEMRAPALTPCEMRYAIVVCNHFDKYSYSSKDGPAAAPVDQADTASTFRREKFSLIKDVQDATYYDLVGQVVKLYPSNDRTDLYISDYTPNPLLYFYQWGQDEDGTDTREGDEYGYISRITRNTKKWPGPFGKLTLPVTLWSPHSEFASRHIKESDFVFLRNAHIRLDRDTKIVGSLHSDKRYPDRIDISVLTNLQNDERVKAVLRRKMEYHKKFDQQSEKYVLEARKSKQTKVKEEEKPEKKDNKPQSRKKKKKQAKKKEHRTQIMEKANAKRKHSDDSENDPPKDPHETPATSPPPQKAPKLDSEASLNENIRCSHHLTPITPISTILSPNYLTNTTPNGTTYTLPFQNVNMRTTVRVIDFWPSRLEDFAIPKRQRSEYAILSDYEDSDSDNDPPSSFSLFTPTTASARRANRAPSANNDDPATQTDPQEWEWRFAFLLEDASSPHSLPKDRPTLKAYIVGTDAECLLKLDAENLCASPTALAALREKLFLLWGNLEERKARERDGDGGGLKETDDNALNRKEVKVGALRGRPFQCCLKEYGVKVKAKEGDKEGNGGDVGEGEPGGERRWERRWRMWGCTII